jgi:hypothetical protein
MLIAALDRYALRMVYGPGGTRQHFLQNFLQKVFVKPSQTWPGCMIDTVNTRALTRPGRLEPSRRPDVVAFTLPKELQGEVNLDNLTFVSNDRLRQA